MMFNLFLATGAAIITVSILALRISSNAQGWQRVLVRTVAVLALLSVAVVALDVARVWLAVVAAAFARITTMPIGARGRLTIIRNLITSPSQIVVSDGSYPEVRRLQR